MSAKDYPITPGYDFGGTLSPYSKANPHLGRDRACPLNTPVVVVDTEIGLAGETGGADGVHTHAAKWKPGQLPGGIYVSKYNATYFDPSDVFETPGTVSNASYNPVAGNYVRWENGDGFTREIFHMNKLNVKVGDTIQGGGTEPVLDDNAIKILWEGFYDEPPKQSDLDGWRGKSPLQLIAALYSSQKYKDRHEGLIQHYIAWKAAKDGVTGATVLKPGNYKVQ